MGWETGEGTTSIGLGEGGGVGEGCCGLAEFVTNGEARIVGAEWVGFVELWVSSEYKPGPTSRGAVGVDRAIEVD